MLADMTTKKNLEVDDLSLILVAGHEPLATKVVNTIP